MSMVTVAVTQSGVKGELPVVGPSGNVPQSDAMVTVRFTAGVRILNRSDVSLAAPGEAALGPGQPDTSLGPHGNGG